MEKLKVSEILKATGGRLIWGDLKREIPGISSDSRKIKKDELFIALKGASYNGHDFIPEAIKKEACGAIISKLAITNYQLPFTILVKDTLKALGQIAQYYREKFNYQ